MIPNFEFENCYQKKKMPQARGVALLAGLLLSENKLKSHRLNLKIVSVLLGRRKLFSMPNSREQSADFHA